MHIRTENLPMAGSLLSSGIERIEAFLYPFLSVYLICIEYVHDRMQEQFEMSGKTSEDLIHMIEEEEND